MSRSLRKDIKLAASQFGKEEEYWLEQLSGDLVLSEFSRDKKAVYTGKRLVDSVKIQFSGELFSRLMKLQGGSDPRLYMILTAGLVVLLGKYTGNTDIIIGAPIFKQEMEGKFINTVLPLRNRIEEQMTFKELLLQVRKTIIDGDEHQNYPMETLVEKLGMDPSRDGAPFFNVAILLTNIHSKSYIEHIHPDTLFAFSRGEESLEVELQYNASIYYRSTGERLVNHLKTILQQALTHIDTKILQLDMLSEDEKKQLLVDFNETRAPYPGDQTIPRLFAGQVKKTPDRIALVFEDRQVTYGELNRRANQMARFLRAKGVNADCIVGFMMDRSLEMFTVLLGILKAGGSYLPLDPDAPDNHIVSLLEDSGTSMVLTQDAVIDRHSFTALQNLHLTRTKPYLGRAPRCITSLDSLPLVDRSLVDYEKYHRFIGVTLVKHTVTLVATRGCPYDCAYCYKIWGKQYNYRSAEHIFAELQLYYNMGIRRFTFLDDAFNLNIPNSRRFFQLIIDNKLDVQLFFPTGLRGDILTREYIDLMVKAGTVNMALALETASPRLQKLIRKNLDIERFKENAQYICTTYPHVILDIFTMHGLPSETEDEAYTTLEFLKNLKWAHFPLINIMKIYQKTDMEHLALGHGISRESILNSENLAWHELPDTLPFDKEFTLKYQSEFLNGYFFSRERLLDVLPYQMKILTEDEMVQRYKNYLPIDIGSFDDLLEYLEIKRDELPVKHCVNEDAASVPGINEKMRRCFPRPVPEENALKVFLLDVSQFFTGKGKSHYDPVEPPIGLMCILTYLQRELGGSVNGKIAKPMIDFSDYRELKVLLEEFAPDVIGIRTFTYYRDFFHEIIARIRQWGFQVPIIAGGPYATSDPVSILQDRNLDLVVIGEGEITFTQLIRKFLENDGKLPGDDVLKKIPGIAFIPAGVGSGENINKNRNENTWREILMVEQMAEVLSGRPGFDVEPADKPSDLAYIIYTSGSTGKPKGVMVEHGSVVNLFHSQEKYFNIHETDRILQFAPVFFDASVEQTCLALFTGAALVLIDKNTILDAGKFDAFISARCLTHLHAVPSFLNIMGLKNNYNLKRIIAGGDICPVTLAKKWSKYCDFYNEYGPTETTVTSIEMHVQKENENESRFRLPIGKPIDNTRVYLFDRWKNPVPLGAAGELYIGGDGVARGYLNQPELTAEKFLSFSYRSYKSYRTYISKKIYKTDDLARWLPDGNIEFLGRVDHQVKIRGFRIEPGEIEVHLLRHGQVKEAVVLAEEDDDGDKFLAAYIVSGSKISIPGLREYLLKYLPPYMVPSYFMEVEEIPFIASGKIDRKALPGLELNLEEKYTAPGNKVEEKMVELWAELLKRRKETIGIDTNFFEIGGNSLKITTLVSRIQREFNVKLSLFEAFKSPTIRELASHIPSEETNIAAVIDGDERLVLLKKAGNKEIAANLFFIHEITGQVEAYIQLSNHLNTPFACYGIRMDSSMSDRYVPGISTIDDFAAQYIEIIKKIQPDGPYYIVGYSIGGGVAFAMARQLEQENNEVKFLGLIDTTGPLEEIREKNHQYTINMELDWVKNWLDNVEIEDNQRMAINEKLSQLTDLDRVWPFIADYFTENHIPADILKKLVPPDIARLIPNFEQMGVRELIGYQTLIHSLAIALNFYLPANKLASPMHFFMPTETEDQDQEEIHRWQEYCRTPIHTYEVPGSHITMMQEPNVVSFARQLEDILSHMII